MLLSGKLVTLINACPKCHHFEGKDMKDKVLFKNAHVGSLFLKKDNKCSKIT